MTKVEKLARDVQALSAKDLAGFRSWFAEFDAAVWDRQMEEDARAGKLDAFAAEALSEYQSGRTQKL